MNYSIILASQSPRRQQLLQLLEWKFEVLVANTDENFPADLPLMQIPIHIAQQKAAAVKTQALQKKHPNPLIIAADTIVHLNGKILGKPTHRKEAIDMLSQLANNTHDVVTGVCLMNETQQHSFSVLTKVHFLPLSNEQIIYYVDQYQPYDKAGSYGVQEWIGLVAIKGIEGCYFNVMGLPVSALYQAVEQFG